MVDKDPERVHHENPENPQDAEVPFVEQPAAEKKTQAAADQKGAEREKRITGMAKQRRHERRKRTVKFYAEGLGALATVAIAILTWAYVNYSSKQWQTMETQLELSSRPWVSVDVSVNVARAFSYTKLAPGLKFASMAIQLVFNNTGNSPALNIRLVTGMLPFGPNHFDPVAEQREMCKRLQNTPPDRLDPGYTLFPGKHVVLEDQVVTMNVRDVLIAAGFMCAGSGNSDRKNSGNSVRSSKGDRR